MATVATIGGMIGIVRNILDFLTNQGDKKKANVIEAHRAINTAFIQTYDYLRNRAGEYIPRPDLAEAWNLASAAVMKFDENLGDMLYHKSRFWLDPDLYINLNRDSEVIGLNELVAEMEKLRIKL
jgi:hypothetical protein